MQTDDLNILDRIIGYISPVSALRRRQARIAYAAYEAAKSSRLRKGARDVRSPDLQVQQGAATLRALARNLEQNHDIARGALQTLVNNVIGPNGIGIEPQPRRADGTIHDAYATALREAYRDWCLNPEVTHRHHYAKVQRLVARTWFRDGEVFAQRLMGPVALLDHGTNVPYSLEMIEADIVPMDYHDIEKGIQQGIERNTWGRPTGFWCYKEFPNGASWLKRSYEMKRIPAERMHHVASIDRIGQMRGVTSFASVLTRLEDIKDYEESERIAAKVAASLTAYIKKGSPESYGDTNIAGAQSPDSTEARQIGMAPGMIITGLAPGEDIGMIDSNRPNPNLVTFRGGQLRAVAAGLGASYSSLARDYSGTYSAQRQELVEQWIHYAVLTDEFVGQFVQPVWKDFVLTAHLSGVVPRPKDVVASTADDALFVGQSMPWIDPLKEAMAWLALVQAGFASEVEVMRRRGANPRDVLAQINKHRREAGEMGLVFNSDFSNVMKQPQPTTDAPAAQQGA